MLEERDMSVLLKSMLQHFPIRQLFGCLWSDFFMTAILIKMRDLTERNILEKILKTIYMNCSTKKTRSHGWVAYSVDGGLWSVLVQCCCCCLWLQTLVGIFWCLAAQIGCKVSLFVAAFVLYLKPLPILPQASVSLMDIKIIGRIWEKTNCL